MSSDGCDREKFVKIMWEIQNDRKFDPSQDSKSFHQLGAVKLQIGDAPSAGRGFADSNLQLVKYDKPLKSISNVKIHFLSVEDVLNITKKHQFKGKFDIAFIAHNYFSFLKSDFTEILNSQALLLFETKKYSVQKQNEINEGIQGIKNFCKEQNFQPITSFALNIVNSILKYKRI